MANPDMVPYYAMALDPVHVGSGKQRLGRVDMPIMREEATKLPIIPGSSICGVTRAAVAINEGKYPTCAGKGEEEKRTETGGDDSSPDTRSHCGNPECPVCVTFGFSKKESSFQGLASFYDAKVVFFPVNTIVGTMWITCRSALEGTTIRVSENVPAGDTFVSVSGSVFSRLPAIGNSGNGKKQINLGWLRLEAGKGLLFDIWPEKIPAAIKENAVLVGEALFSRIVNGNLETRTSVSIDPLTGAADSGALFTYEAIPRSTLFFFQVGIADPNHFKINKEQISISKNNIEEKVTAGLKQLEFLGIGGMNTRGMGRIRLYEAEKKNDETPHPSIGAEPGTGGRK